MSKSDLLKKWKSLGRADVKLPSGITVTLELTTLRDEILAGSFTAPVVGLARQLESGVAELNKELTDEELKNVSSLKNTLISRTIVAVEHEPVRLTEEDVSDLPVEDLDDLWLYAMRLKPLIKGDEKNPKA